MKKRYAYTYEDYDDNNKGASTLVTEIMEDPELPSVNEIEIGCWGNAWEDDCQPILDDIIAHKETFDHIQKLSIGIMDYEDCEISWIMQGNYSQFWAALPHLKSITIQGSTNLVLGDIVHDQLEHLEIICGGLPMEVLENIVSAKLPNLKELILYFGVEDYGFDGTPEEVQEKLSKMDFPKLEYLGLVNSDMQDALAELAIHSKLMPQLQTLDLSCGTLTDEGGAILLEALPRFPHLKKLDLHYHYLSGSMMQKLAQLPIETDLSEQNEAEHYHGEYYYSPMITE